MTEQEFLALELRERDALVAEKVMGEAWVRGQEEHECGYVDNGYILERGAATDDGVLWGWPVLEYTTRIAPAWQVVEKMHDVEGGHYEDFDNALKAYPLPLYCLEADIAAQVICIAALKAKGEIESTA